MMRVWRCVECGSVQTETRHCRMCDGATMSDTVYTADEMEMMLRNRTTVAVQGALAVALVLMGVGGLVGLFLGVF